MNVHISSIEGGVVCSSTRNNVIAFPPSKECNILPFLYDIWEGREGEGDEEEEEDEEADEDDEEEDDEDDDGIEVEAAGGWSDCAVSWVEVVVVVVEVIVVVVGGEEVSKKVSLAPVSKFQMETTGPDEVKRKESSLTARESDKVCFRWSVLGIGSVCNSCFVVVLHILTCSGPVKVN